MPLRAMRGVEVQPLAGRNASFERGYGLATVITANLDRTLLMVSKNGVHPLFLPGRANLAPAGMNGGRLGAWAWGLSRAWTTLATDPGIDARRVAVLGHSRLGKPLCGPAQDARFALVISNDFGLWWGQKLSRAQILARLWPPSSGFPALVLRELQEVWRVRADSCRFDQHMLLALTAPRPVYVASAVEDLHADPRGEYLAAYQAVPVFSPVRVGGSTFARTSRTGTAGDEPDWLPHSPRRARRDRLRFGSVSWILPDLSF